MGRVPTVLFALAWSVTGCTSAWDTVGLVTPEQVAVALGERDGDLGLAPRIGSELKPPERVRPCCVFGMDLKMKVGEANIPGYQVSNITDVDELGSHEYDNGWVSLTDRVREMLEIEKDGLIYTCRGGFVDTAHVRDYADMTLFLAASIAAILPSSGTITLTGDGSERRVYVRPLPDDLKSGLGTWEVAITLAQHIAFRMSVWHEIVTWYGYASTMGFPEKVSAFSPEDLYSNALGVRIAGGILRSNQVAFRDVYNRLMVAWLRGTLEYLGAVPIDEGRRAMHALDGRWWDSKESLPTWTLVTKRYLELPPRIAPWTLRDAGGDATRVDGEICPTHPRPLALDLPTTIGDHPIGNLVVLEFGVGSWAPKRFPFSNAKKRLVESDDFPQIVEAIQREMSRTLGNDVHRPGGSRQ